MRAWWGRRSIWGKIGLVVLALFVVFIAIGVIGVATESESTAEQTPPATTEEETTTEETTTEEEATTEEATTEEATTEEAPSPQDKLREALGDKVEAEGFAGDLEVKDVTFAGGEAQVIVITPEGGLEGPSCADLDDGARAVFEKVYNEGGWPGRSVLGYQGGLVDSSTGEELPDVHTGIFTMPANKARAIDWTDEDVLLNIDWSLYRDFCHPALKQ